MELSQDEKKLLKILVIKEKEEFDNEGKTLIVDDNPGFEELEERYDEFLEKLIKKL